MAKRPKTDKQPPPTSLPVGSDKIIAEATGTEEPYLQQQLINQVCDAIWLPENLGEKERAIRVNSAISMLQSIKPADGVEGMLATQMVATHNAAMECLFRAMIPEISIQGRDQSLKHATKLLSIFSRQIEVLNKHRGKGQQKMTIEHVNVESGGQAMVGHIEAGNADGAPKKGS